MLGTAPQAHDDSGLIGVLVGHTVRVQGPCLQQVTPKQSRNRFSGVYMLRKLLAWSQLVTVYLQSDSGFDVEAAGSWLHENFLSEGELSDLRG